MKIKINGIFYVKDEIPDGSLSILQACEEFGFNIPKFCYHPKLSIAGNCRMCLVEVEGAPKPVASCAMPQSATTSVFLDTPLVKKARESVMEFLLLNHPLDCPVCDQGGECDLQDEALLFGNDKGRFFSTRRSVVNKNTGPLVKMVMTRCIHCTRCVRFSSEISGFSELGATGRGNSMEIGPYVDKVLKTELSGNVIDLCPVGALTSKPYAFSGRPWEAKSIDTIDTSDAVGTPIVVQIRKNSVSKIVPKDNSFLSIGWIHDRTRFSYDGISVQRLTHPFVKIGAELKKTNFLDAVALFKDWFLRKTAINFNDAVSFLFYNAGLPGTVLFALKSLSVMHNNSVIFSNPVDFGVLLNKDFKHSYTFNTKFQKLSYSDSYVLIGTDVRFEYPILHTQLISTIKTGAKIVYFGKFIDSKLLYSQQSITPTALLKFVAGRDTICQKITRALRPLFVTTVGFTKNFKYQDYFNQLLGRLAMYTRIYSFDKTGHSNWAGFNTLLSTANSFLVNELGLFHRYNNIALDITSAKFVDSDKIFYATDHPLTTLSSNNSTILVKNISLSSHFSTQNACSDLLLPIATSFEFSDRFVNNEGRVQFTQGAISPEGDLFKETLLDTLFLEKSAVKFEYDYNMLIDSVDFELLKTSMVSRVAAVVLVNQLIVPKIKNFYQTDGVSTASANMAKARMANYPQNFPTI